MGMGDVCGEYVGGYFFRAWPHPGVSRETFANRFDFKASRAYLVEP